MDNDITVYIFYLIRDVQNVYKYEKYDIYAYTTDKKIAKEFKLTRDMNKFYLKKINMTRKELNDMYKYNMNAQLEIHNGTTYLSDYKPIKFSMVLTRDY